MHANVQRLQAEHGRRLDAVTTVTQPDISWKGRVGRINIEALAPYALTCSIFFIAGGLEFVAGMVNLLLQLGVWPARIRTDCFPALGERMSFIPESLEKQQPSRQSSVSSLCDPAQLTPRRIPPVTEHYKVPTHSPQPPPSQLPTQLAHSCLQPGGTRKKKSHMKKKSGVS